MPFRGHLSPPDPSLSCTPCPGQPLLFLSLCICPFWTFCINRIQKCVVFCDQLLLFSIMSSRVIRVVTEARIPFLFHGCILFHHLHPHNCVHPFPRRWTFVVLPCLGCYECRYGRSFTSFCVWTYVCVSLASHRGLRSLGHGVALLVTFRESAGLFPKWLHLYYPSDFVFYY